jgi:hypothetical protein
MKHIEEFNFRVHNLRNAEHFQLHNSMKQFLEPHVEEVDCLHEPWDAYKGCWEKEERVFRVSHKVEETVQLANLDKLRDEDFRFIGRAIALECRSRDAIRREAAQCLAALFDQHKRSYNKAYAENTALVICFLQDLEKPKNREAVETLAFEHLVHNLRADNTAFEILYNKRSEHLNLRRQDGNMRNVRRDVDRAYRAFAEAVNAVYIANVYGQKDEGLRQRLEEIIDGVNARITQMRYVYARRS